MGRTLLGLCPFHDDREPSLVVSPEKNLWHCLGACQAGGSPIDWVMRDRGVSFRHAVELLRADLPMAGGGQVKKKAALPVVVESAAEDAELLRQVVGFYHETLKESPEALEYLAARGLQASGDDRAVSAGVRQSDAWATGCRRRRRRPARRCGSGCVGWGFYGSRGTSISMGRWWFRFSKV